MTGLNQEGHASQEFVDDPTAPAPLSPLNPPADPWFDQPLLRGATTNSQERAVHEIEVITISAEEAEHGVAELWAGGRQIAYTLLDDGELKLRFLPRHDGTPVVVGMRSLTEALAEVDRALAAY
jgi:hypothetical protein